jgi:hypothetical protein
LGGQRQLPWFLAGNLNPVFSQRSNKAQGERSCSDDWHAACYFSVVGRSEVGKGRGSASLHTAAP